jgi:hypothetical protein
MPPSRLRTVLRLALGVAGALLLLAAVGQFVALMGPPDGFPEGFAVGATLLLGTAGVLMLGGAVALGTGFSRNQRRLLGAGVALLAVGLFGPLAVIVAYNDIILAVQLWWGASALGVVAVAVAVGWRVAAAAVAAVGAD